MSKMTKPTKIKAVLFDLGKVLLHFDFEPAFKTLSRHCDKTPKDIEAYFIQSGLEVLYDGGKVTSKRFYLEVRKALGLRLGYEAFKHAWNHIFTPIMPMWRLVAELRERGYRLVLISNTNQMHFEFAKKRYAVLKRFHRHVLSYKVKMRKPDEHIYRVAMKACRAKAPEILYIDDRADLTGAAEELGFHTFTFKKNHDELVAHMKALGVL
jgi:glucose-1-phosphatase